MADGATGSNSIDSIRARLSRLKRLDQISVAWIDASQSSNVSIAGKIPNHAVETRVVSTGKFLGLQESDTFHEAHLLILKDSSDHHRGTVQSIPIVLIKQVELFGKMPLLFKKRSKGTAIRIRYSDGITKTVRITERNALSGRTT